MPTPTEQKVYCVIDCRISSTKQQTGGGLDDQEKICKNFTNTKGWEVTRVFSKVYSGRAEERKDFQEIKDFIRLKRKENIAITKYVIKSIDRITRDGAVTFMEMKGDLKKLGVELVDVYGVIQPDQNTLAHVGISFPWSMRSPTASTQLQEAEDAKGEVTKILSRMLGSSISRVQEGYKARPPTDGFLNKHIFVAGKIKVIEEPDPARVHFFRTMFDLRIQGVDDKEIVARVNAMGFRTKERNRYNEEKTEIIGKTGNNLLTVKQLQRIIPKPIYAGIKCERWTHFKPIRAKYDGIVSIDEFNEANRGKVYIKEHDDGSLELLSNYTQFGKGIRRLRDNPDFRYKFFHCEICHLPMLGSWSTGKSGIRYPAYHCGGASGGARAHKYIRVPKEEYENAVKNFISSLRFTSVMVDTFEKVLNDVYRTREQEVVSQSSMISHTVGSLKAQQASALNTLTVTQNQIVRKKLEEMIDELESQIQQAEVQRDEIEVTERDIKAFVKSVKTIMEHPSEILIGTDNMHAQQVLFGLVFEEIPTYAEVLNGTPKLSLAFKLSDEYLNSKTQSVTPRRVELRLPA